MYKLTEENNKLVLTGKYGTESIHLIHCSNSIEDLKEDACNIYMVAEECTNFARVHLLTDFSEDEALQQVDSYLIEKEGVDETHLIAVFKVSV